MSKAEYRASRALVRANGVSAYNWISTPHAQAFECMAKQQDDHLKDRQKYSKDSGMNLRGRLLLTSPDSVFNAFKEKFKKK
jgi:hypothetical protein